MCKSLHGKYPEYNRKKFRVFKEQVETAFQKLLSGGAPTSRELIDIPDMLGCPLVVFYLPKLQHLKQFQVNGSLKLKVWNIDIPLTSVGMPPTEARSLQAQPPIRRRRMPRRRRTR